MYYTHVLYTAHMYNNYYYTCIQHTCIVHVLMRDEKKERKKQARSSKQINKAKQHSTPKAVTFPKKNELPRVGLEPTTLYTLDRVLYHCVQCQWNVELGPEGVLLLEKYPRSLNMNTS